jgi:hypothetical protein
MWAMRNSLTSDGLYFDKTKEVINQPVIRAQAIIGAMTNNFLEITADQAIALMDGWPDGVDKVMMMIDAYGVR